MERVLTEQSWTARPDAAAVPRDPASTTAAVSNDEFRVTRRSMRCITATCRIERTLNEDVKLPKYVASRTLRQQDLTWSGSTLLPADDAIGAVRELRERDGNAVQVMGSSSLAAQLIAHDLVDEYRLMIEPILLGSGKRVFPNDGQSRALELVAMTTARHGFADLHLPARWPLTITCRARHTAMHQFKMPAKYL